MRARPLVLALALFLWSASGLAYSQALGPEHVKLALVAETSGATPGSTIYVAVAQDIERGWHTYWRNPGDVGEATEIAWTLPPGWRAGDIVWPAPERLPVGPLMDYGYEGEVLLAAPLVVPASATPGQTAHVSAAVSLLVCADTCVPQTSRLSLDLPIVAGEAAPDPDWGERITGDLMAAPKPAGLAATYQLTPGALKIAVTGPDLRDRRGADAYFFPYEGGIIDQAKPEAIDLGEQGLTFTLAPGDLAPKGALAGVVVQGVLETDGRAYEVTAKAGPPPPGSSGLGPPAARRTLDLPTAAFFAFLGGLILNLMPCVFPILSMKAAALVARPHEAAYARRQGLAFFTGALTAFMALALIIIVLRDGGQAVGWGSQLQPPLVTAALSLVMLAAALDLSGVFEIGASLQGLGGGLAARADLVGGVFTGALAVVVAAPCTAPFMGPAVGYALTAQRLSTALAVFAALAVGFTLPFTALAFTPWLWRRLPKPGPWMDAFKKALALPMYGTAAWLLWVLTAQTDRRGVAAALAAAILLVLAAWIYGRAQRRMAAGRAAPRRLAAAGIALVLAALTIGLAPFPPPPTNAAGQAVFAKIPSQPWSPERLAALRAQDRPVFVDFTAAWCVTCQLNEVVALNTEEAASAFKRTGAVLLRADWTNRDGAIAKALADEGRAGVPLYLVYGADGGAPKILPQLLSAGAVAQALDAAAPAGKGPPAR